MAKKNSHCSYCGARFEAESWPRRCGACTNISYINPLPVAVCLVPVDGGLLLVRRDIEPHIGKLALPGGFIEVNESWQQAAAREVVEETGVVIAVDTIRDFCALSAPDGTLLVFGVAAPVTTAALPDKPPTGEVSELVILHEAKPLAFPLHSRVVERYFAG